MAALLILAAWLVGCVRTVDPRSSIGVGLAITQAPSSIPVHSEPAPESVPTRTEPATPAATPTGGPTGETTRQPAGADRPIATQLAGPSEAPVTLIPLAGPVTASEAEVSGLAWYGDYLILLPQFPRRMSAAADGALFAIPQAELLEFLDGERPGPLEPIEIPLVTSGLEKRISGFEGFEAIDFEGEQAFMAIEASAGGAMMGYLVTGQMAPDLSELRLEQASLTRNRPQANLTNRSDEALLVAGSRVFTIYEANGAEVNPDPQVHMFDFDLSPEGTLAFPQIEYRVTDATGLDDHGRFWVINFNYQGDTDVQTGQDPLAEQFGQGPSHARSASVERLLELQLGHDGITLSGTQPVQLQLLGDIAPRNWEGLARLEGRGFLLVTDKFPLTMLAFVPEP